MSIQQHIMKQTQKKHWFVFYTSPRAEKKVNIHLQSLNYETFLPLKKEFKIWKNRQRKYIEVPLFPSYIFVNTFQYEISVINRIRGICTCVTCAKKPVYISENDIMSLKIMQDMDISTVNKDNPIIGDRIRIMEGPLCGYEGVLIKIKEKDKFAINIEDVNLIAAVDLQNFKIEKIIIT